MKLKILYRTLKQLVEVYAEPRILIMLAIGFSCGIPLLLTASTLALWLKQSGLSYSKIGTISLCALPYTFKFVWAPFLDHLNIPYLTNKLGRRRSWLLLSQLMLIVCIVGLSLNHPQNNLNITIMFATGIAFASATQDIIMLAYQVERLKPQQYGAGEAMGIFGYRMGLLTSGAGALYLAESLTWNQVYQIMAALILVGVVTTLCIKEPAIYKKRNNQVKLIKKLKALSRLRMWLFEAVISPFIDFSKRNNWVLAIAIMFLYKISDNLIGNMSNIFFTDIGFTKSQIASASKVFGMANSILGGLLGGIIIMRLGLVKSLFISALIHGLSILLYVVMDQVGPNMSLLYGTIAIEHITGGMRTVALLNYQMLLVNPHFAATQFALLTSIVHMGRTYVASLSGYIADYFGWSIFFTISAAATLVSLLLIILLARDPKSTLKLTINRT